eukprot:3566186-Karenia_brevis.AAC.1
MMPYADKARYEDDGLEPLHAVEVFGGRGATTQLFKKIGYKVRNFDVVGHADFDFCSLAGF